MRCAGAISGPDVRQFALAQRQSGRRGAACSLVPYRTLGIIDSALAFGLQTQPKPAASGPGETTRPIPGPRPTRPPALVYQRWSM